MEPEEKLVGGNMTQVSRAGHTVRREAGSWTPQVHKLLTHLRAKGIQEVPEPRGFDAYGREILSFIPGVVGHHPLSESMRTDEVLISAAQLLRRIHDATLDVAQIWNTGWRAPVQSPVEVICHGDFAPYNCVFSETGKLIGVIDFDFAHLGSRVWDLAYALYRFVPICAPSNPEHGGDLLEQCRRTKLFCEVYQLEDASDIIQTIKLRIAYMADFLRQGAASGDQRLQDNIDRGDLEIYMTDCAYVETHEEQFLKALDNIITL
jgi:Phosphotransferase enzyme family